jgi:hypothetical protein
LIMFGFMNAFYYGRVFAGGDAKLLVAMTVFFVGASFYVTLMNIGIFLLFLMLSGSVYGLIYSGVLYVKDFSEVNKKVRKIVDGRWWYLSVFVLLLLLGFFDWRFLFFGVFGVLILVLYVFAKALESVSMIRVVSGKDLREGDWLVDDVKVKGKVVEADWDGLSLEDIELLRKKKKIKIKDGLPFVPAFLIAFLSYVFLRGRFIDFIVGLV